MEERCTDTPNMTEINDYELIDFQQTRQTKKEQLTTLRDRALNTHCVVHSDSVYEMMDIQSKEVTAEAPIPSNTEKKVKKSPIKFFVTLFSTLAALALLFSIAALSVALVLFLKMGNQQRLISLSEESQQIVFEERLFDIELQWNASIREFIDSQFQQQASVQGNLSKTINILNTKLFSINNQLSELKDNLTNDSSEIYLFLMKSQKEAEYFQNTTMQVNNNLRVTLNGIEQNFLTQLNNVNLTLGSIGEQLRLEIENKSQNLSNLLNRRLDLHETELSSLDSTIVTTQTDLLTKLSSLCLSLEICDIVHIIGLRRIAFINMTDPNQDCPQGLSLTGFSVRSCGRGSDSRATCSSVTFSAGGSQYSRVYGRVRGYRWGNNYAFYSYHSLGQTIDGYYVDGLSITYGSPRQHIWTFASGLFKGTSSTIYQNFRCPCDPGNTYGSPPFVGNDYFCESVATETSWVPYRFHPENALWDGQDNLNPCFGLNNPPWFLKTLDEPTTADIELRMCFADGSSVSDIGIELVEIYIGR